MSASFSRFVQRWRTPLVLAAFALLAWVGIEIGRAGSDVPLQRPNGASTLQHGSVSGKRLDGRAWSMDYDTATMSADGAQATIAHVNDGLIHRAGKPDVHMKADNVTVNTTTNDVVIVGHVSFREPLPNGATRTFETVGARYVGATRLLELDHPSTITDNGATIRVEKVSANFRTGDLKIGRIVGTKPGTSP